MSKGNRSNPTFVKNQYPEEDAAAGFEITPEFERFNQRDDVFRRSWWDETIRTEKSELFYATYREPLKSWRRAEGFGQKDYALRNASWHVSDIFTEANQDQDRREGFTDAFTSLRDPADSRMDFGSLEQAAGEIKRVAKAFGAGLVGITHYDQRWEYARRFSDLCLVEKEAEIKPELERVVVVAQPMDYDWIRTVPSALSGAATGLGYSHDALVVLSLAQYIRNLGYKAIPSMNDTSLAVPYAIKAGLGEYSRLGLLITREFGPRLRLGKVYTDMPLALDKPVRFGVKEFCEICLRCSDACPVKAVPAGEPSAEVYNRSNIKGVRKWSVDGEKCFGYWVNQNSDCSICLRVCPYNKDYSNPLHRLALKLAGTGLRRALLWLDLRLGYGERVRPDEWWHRN